MKILIIIAAIIFASEVYGQDTKVLTLTELAASPAGIKCSTALPERPHTLLRDRNFREATTLIEVTIIPGGEIESVVVKEPSGYKAWDAASIKAMGRIRCDLGQPVTATVKATEKLSLKIRQ
jgi:hypothetical protein